MESLFPYLLWGGLFFLMMRFGCGSHMFGHRNGDQGQAKSAGHGGGHGCCGPTPKTTPEKRDASQANLPSSAVHKDPVCGMSVALDSAKTSIHAGKVHYFCSRDCREIFEASPESYLNGAAHLPGRSAVPSIPHHRHADEDDSPSSTKP